jgi:large subunit ribosomal protein L30
MSSSAQTSEKNIAVTLVRSPIGFSKRHKATVRALGLHRLHQTVEHVDSPSLRGMLYQVSRLVVVEEIGDAV